jgi:hypothetical protein
MPILAAALAIVAALCLLDMLMTFGVIRRLREHTELISGMNVPGAPVIGLAIGESPMAFSSGTIGGELVSGTAGLRLVAFFSTGCSACPERVAPFAAYVAQNRLSKNSVLAVVVGNEDSPPPYLSQLTEVALVCADGLDGPVSRAFNVAGFPAFCLLDSDGSVLAAGFNPVDLPEPVAAR